jgi:UDP-galactopyranose mutase
MKLIKDEASVWETHIVEGYPFGIEKIDRGAWYPFQFYGKRRIYLSYKGMGKEKAAAILKERLEDYKSKIIEGVSA